MSDDKLIEDLVTSVQQDDAFKAASSGLSAEDKASVEASVREMAELMAPFLRAFDALSQDEEALALAKAKLSEKPSVG